MHDNGSSLKYLDQCLPDRRALSRLRAVLDKIEKCCTAADKGFHLSDLVNDRDNRASLEKVLGPEDFATGIQILVKLALQDFEKRSFTLKHEIQGQKKFDFIFRAVGGWKQFQGILYFQIEGSPLLLNLTNGTQWKDFAAGVGELPQGTVVTVYLRTEGSRRSRSQESLALERIEAVFDVVQNRSEDLNAAPVIQLHRGPAEPATTTAPKAQATARPAARKPANKPAVRNGHGSNGHRANGSGSNGSARVSQFANPFGAPKGRVPSGPPVMSFQVIVNKLDTVVHAGNAQLILNHIKDYPGRVQMYVLRAEKKIINMDADSIWSAECRNGETILFEFFGPQPDDEFVKELAKKVNKYTQMDKVVND